jgi:Zn-dependent protease
VFAVVLTLVARSHENELAHPRFWYGLAFLGVLQVTAAVLNLLPVPGLDGYAIIEPYLDHETVRVGEKVKPWGLFVVILLLFYVTPVKNAFFNLVDAIYRAIGGTNGLHDIGYFFFRWWVKNPL